jgi:hypothetical protein
VELRLSNAALDAAAVAIELQFGEAQQASWKVGLRLARRVGERH